MRRERTFNLIAQVSGKLYQVMTIMAERSPTFGKPSAAIAIGHLCEKLGDMKLKKPAGDALSMFAEKTSLAFVLAQCKIVCLLGADSDSIRADAEAEGPKSASRCLHVGQTAIDRLRNCRYTSKRPHCICQDWSAVSQCACTG